VWLAVMSTSLRLLPTPTSKLGQSLMMHTRVMAMTLSGMRGSSTGFLREDHRRQRQLARSAQRMWQHFFTARSLLRDVPLLLLLIKTTLSDPSLCVRSLCVLLLLLLLIAVLKF
jgi:hypothetical protein